MIKKYHGTHKMKQYQDLAQKHIDLEMVYRKINDVPKVTDHDENRLNIEGIEGWGSSVQIRLTEGGGSEL